MQTTNLRMGHSYFILSICLIFMTNEMSCLVRQCEMFMEINDKNYAACQIKAHSV